MSDHACQPVSVSRKINAPAERLFALLAAPANHPRIDGSGSEYQMDLRVASP